MYLPHHFLRKIPTELCVLSCNAILFKNWTIITLGWFAQASFWNCYYLIAIGLVVEKLLQLREQVVNEEQRLVVCMCVCVPVCLCAWACVHLNQRWKSYVLEAFMRVKHLPLHIETLVIRNQQWCSWFPLQITPSHIGSYSKELKSEPCPVSHSANVSWLNYEDTQNILD